MVTVPDSSVRPTVRDSSVRPTVRDSSVRPTVRDSSVRPTVRERLAAPGPHFSVEFYPPRSDAEETILWSAIRRLEPLRPVFVSVTTGAAGSSRDRTVRVTERIATQTTLTPVAHLVVAGSTVADLRHLIGSYAAVGVRNLLALRGDPPGDDPLAAWTPTEGGLTYAAELVALAKSLGTFSVGVAGFPEKHPRSPDVATDVRRLAEKVGAGADYIVSQMLFSASDYTRFRDRLAAEGVDVPIIPGIMPVTSSARLARICALSGQSYPAELAGRLDAVKGDPAASREIGLAHALAMCRELLAQGAPALHFYTFNRSRLTLEILAELGVVPGRPMTPGADGRPVPPGVSKSPDLSVLAAG
jgi:methylenetetrahydrofolate reductase (NADPH)